MGENGSNLTDGVQPLTTRSRTSSVHVFDAVHAFDDDEGNATKETVQRWVREKKGEWRRRAYTYSFLDWLTLMFPCLQWLRNYSIPKSLPMDIAAGVSVAFMVVPQGISYADLAGVPPVWGLYGAFVPVLVYAMFGSSRHLAVGPVAVTSILIGKVVEGILPDSKSTDENIQADVQDEQNHIVLQITFLVGVMWFIVGVLRLDFLANFLSHSVISGFTTGAAFTIALTQLKVMFNVGKKDPPFKTGTALETVITVFEHLSYINWREVVMCIVWLMLLLVMKNLGKRFKRLKFLRAIGPITVCVIAIAVNVIGDLDTKGLIAAVKTVPKGLPNVTINQWLPLLHPAKQLRTAAIVFLVDFLESISIAKAVARMHDYEIVVDQEIVAVGLANLVGGMFSSYTTTGSFSRSALASDIGAKTQLQGVISALLVMLVLLFITPVFERLPKNATAAIILSSVAGLVNFGEARYLFKVHFLDFLVWSAAFLGTVLAGVEIGLAVAISLAILLVVYQSAFPHTAVLGQLPDTQVWRNIKQYPTALQHKQICVVRVDAPIYFANVEWIRTRVTKYAERGGEDKSLRPVRFVVLDLAPVPFIDATGAHTIKDLVGRLRTKGMRLVLANPARQVQQQLKAANLLEEIGQDWIFVRTADAVAMCRQMLAEEVEDSVQLPLAP